MLKNCTFSYIEIRHFNLSKSSDASLVYAKVLDAKLPSFNENVALILHYNQALLDIQDDWEDKRMTFRKICLISSLWLLLTILHTTE